MHPPKRSGIDQDLGIDTSAQLLGRHMEET